jgi:hypothetical protein
MISVHRRSVNLAPETAEHDDAEIEDRLGRRRASNASVMPPPKG